MILSSILLALAMPVAGGADMPKPPSTLSATEIADKDIAARGGLQAWRTVQTLSFSGKLDAGGRQHTQLPFVLRMKRPRKTRVELEFQNQTAVQVYDGVKGWKLRPYLGRNDVEPFTADELQAASMESDLDGPLVDYASKGARLELEGMEKVEGHDAYKLKLTAKGGSVRHLWVDAQTFLELKIDGVPRRMDGKMRAVQVYYRDYKNVNGLMVPYVLETIVQGATHSHKMNIESVQVNPKLDDSLFLAPKAEARKPGAPRIGVPLIGGPKTVAAAK
jgi:outer membrane lipoprotein-sorting protein